MKNLVTIAFAALFLVGCGSTQLARENSAKAYGKQVLITDLDIKLTEQMEAAVKDVMSFSKIEVAHNINAALDNQELRVEHPGKLPLKMSVTLTGLSVRGSAMAFMFGPLAGSDGLMGEVTLSDKRGKVVDKFFISTTSALGGIVAGGESKRLNRLYSKFAYATAFEITARSPQVD